MPVPEHHDDWERLRAARPELDAAAVSPEHPAAQALMHDIVATAPRVEASHSQARRARAAYRRPHGIAAITCTRSPTFQPSTSLATWLATSPPISTISPAISWPMVRGGTM